jgi:hypothetical protein
MKPTVEDLLVLSDRPESEALRAQAGLQLASAEGMVAGYCRGRHVDAAGEYRPGVGEVVLSLASRMLANPQQVQVRTQVGSVSELRGEVTVGFTLAEQFVLNRYRKRGL